MATNKDNKNLVNVNEGQNALFAGLDELNDFKGDITGLEVVDQSDMKMPKIKLIQPTSLEATKGQCQAGWFYNTVTKEKFESINCVLLRLGKSRVMWKKPFKRGEEPLCRSFDAKNKFDGTVRCDNCKFSKWDNLEDGENKPACNQSYMWLGIDEAKTPFRLIAGGSSVAPTKDFLNLIAPKKYPIFVYIMEISSEQKENDQGVFYILKYTIKGIVNKEDVKDLQELSVGLGDLFMKTIEIDTLHHDEDPVEGAAPGQSGLF